MYVCRLCTKIGDSRAIASVIAGVLVRHRTPFPSKRARCYCSIHTLHTTPRIHVNYDMYMCNII